MRLIIGAALALAGVLASAPLAWAQRLYVVNVNANHLNIYSTSTGTLLNSFAIPANSYAVAVDSVGNYYISYGPSSSTDHVAKYDSAGNLVTSWGTGGIITGTGGPEGIPNLSIDASGANLLVPLSGGAINVYSTSTGALLSTSSTTNGAPVGAAFNTTGTSFFVSTFSAIEQFPAAGGASTTITWGGLLTLPYGIYFQSDTSFLVAGAQLGEIRHYTYNPVTHTATWDTTFNGNVGFDSVSSPYGLTADTSGNFYVSSFNGNTISEFSSTGLLINSTFVSGLNFPEGIAFSPIPEPSSGALLALGAGVLGAIRFRRRRR